MRQILKLTNIASIMLFVMLSGCRESSTIPVQPDSLTEDQKLLFRSDWRQKTASLMSEEQVQSLFASYRQTQFSGVIRKGEVQIASQPTSGPKILMIEANARPTSIYGRFRNRVAGFYEWSDTQNRYQSVQPEYEMAAEADDFFNQLIRTSPNISSSDFSDFASNEVSASLEGKSRAQRLYHGEIVANILMEHNPDAQIVLAPRPAGPWSKVCSVDRPEELATVRKHYEILADEYRRIIREQGIVAVNLSHGLYSSTFARFRNACPHVDFNSSLISFLVENELIILRALTENPEVLVFQGADNVADHRQDPNLIQDRALCFEAPNFVRVGFMTQANAGLPPEGAPIREESLYVSQRNARPCIDVVINPGFSEAEDSWEGAPHILERGARPAFMLGNGGMGSFTLRSMATSWATPYALSLAMFLRASSLEKTGKPLSAVELKQLLLGRAFEPVKYDQSEMLLAYRRIRGKSYPTVD